MKQMTIEKLAGHVDELVATARRERVLLTKGGKPFAFVTDASWYDDEDIALIGNRAFWRMIRERRRSRGGIPLEKVMERIASEERSTGLGATPARRAGQRRRARSTEQGQKV